MILLRLLSTGKSLVGVGQKERFYRPADKGLLPRFKVKSNPFRATALPEAIHQPDEGKLEGQLVTQPEVAPASSVKAEPTPARPGKVAVSAPGLASGSDRWQWVKAIKGICGGKPGKTKGPAVEDAPLQGELRLEAVQVVRNDLTESDIEIVPRAKNPAAPAEKAQGVPADSRAGTDSAWSRVSARIFGPNNVC